jgi:uncharacterized protein (TIGR03437 family)
MRYICFWIAALSCCGATVETVSPGRQLVFVEEGVGQNDPAGRYWLRGTSSMLRLEGETLVAQPRIGGLEQVKFGGSGGVGRLVERLTAKVNYYSGAEAGWRSDVGASRAVEFGNAYPGIDVTVRPEWVGASPGFSDRVKVGMLVRVRPGGDAGRFVLESNSTNARVEAGTGAYSIGFSWWSFVFSAPQAWQMINGRRVAVAARFEAREPGKGGVVVGAYDRGQDLWLETSTWDGAMPWQLGRPESDGAGSVFFGGAVAGSERCSVTPGGTRVACPDALIVKFAANGELLFVTWLTGAVEDRVLDLKLRRDGALVALGNTASADFPVSSSAIQRQNAGPIGPKPRLSLAEYGDLFLARVDPLSGRLLYSTFWGGSTHGESGRLALAGDRVVAMVFGLDKAITNTIGSWVDFAQCLPDGRCNRTGLVRFNAAITQVEAATYFPAGVQVSAMEALPDGTVLVAGSVLKNDASAAAAATAGAYQTELRGDADGYLVRLDVEMRRPLFATYYGAEFGDLFSLLQVDGGGNVLLLGYEFASNRQSAFLVEVASDGRSLRRRFAQPGWQPNVLLRTRNGQVYVGGASDFVTTEGVVGDALLSSPCVDGAGIIRGYGEGTAVTFRSYLPGTSVGVGAMLEVSGEEILLLKGDRFEWDRFRPGAPTQASLGCVAGGASLRSRVGISPGQIVSLFGSKFGPEVGRAAGLTSELKLPLELDGVRVKVNGVAAPLLYVQASQINAVVPYEGVTPGETATVEVEYQGQVVRRSETVVFTSVELFTLDGSGKGQAAAFNEDGSLNSASNPAAAGSIVVLYGTGIGVTAPPSVTGGIAGAPFARPIGPVVGIVDRQLAEMHYAGAAPGLVNGAAQFNLRIPSGVSGEVQVDIRINGSLPANRATIAVR